MTESRAIKEQYDLAVVGAGPTGLAAATPGARIGLGTVRLHAQPAPGGAVGGRGVLAGTGPLVWLLAAQYLRAGVKIEALLDTTPTGNWATALPHLPSFLLSSYLGKGLRLMREVKRGVRIIRGVTALAAHGGDRVEAIGYRIGGGDEIRLPVD